MRVTVARALSAGLLAFAALVSLSAQREEWKPASPLLTTPHRIEAFIRASERTLDYLPGEVLVKFKDGVGVDGQQRALAALRSRPQPSALRWAGQVAVLSDTVEWNAEILS